jgi:hypothetical protein
MKRALATLRDVSPFFVAEALLPGVMLLTLLLWLSQAFIRQGFGELRQHRPAHADGKILFSARAPPRPAGFRLCLSRCAIVTVWRNRFRQWCDAVGRVRHCCA